MGAPSLDNEFLKYWKKLSAVEKESLLTVAKNYVQLKESEEEIGDARKKLILAERESYLQGKGESYSWDKVKAMARNKGQRNVL